MDILSEESTTINDPEASRKRIANEFGLSLIQVTDTLVARIADDPLFLYHLEICKSDPQLLDILLEELKITRQAPVVESTTAELLGRAGAALAHWAASGFSRVSAKQYRKRLSVCRSCEHLSFPSANIGLYKLAGISSKERSVCNLCGCAVRKKAWLATEQCPEARWDKEET